LENSAFFELEFYLLIGVTFIFPTLVYVYMLKKRSISRTHVLFYGIVLIFVAALSVFFLSQLHDIAKLSRSLSDDKLFASELTIALYLVPAIFAGIGINIISHVLIVHLEQAEKAYIREAGK
jgi:hypothetical protein